MRADVETAADRSRHGDIRASGASTLPPKTNGAQRSPAPAHAGPHDHPAHAGPNDPTRAGPHDPTRAAAARPHTVVPLDAMRRALAARLTQATQTVPHFYLRRRARVDALLAAREQVNAERGPQMPRLSVNDFVIRACARALRKVPDANVAWGGESLRRYENVDLAVAVAVAGGLRLPVLRDAQDRTLFEVSADMRALAARARAGGGGPDAEDGATVGISNLGMYGVESFDAVVTPPLSAILAVGAAHRVPGATAGGGSSAWTEMALTLSVDHRALDGALAAQLLGAIIEGLEAPVTLLI